MAHDHRMGVAMCTCTAVASRRRSTWVGAQHERDVVNSVANRLLRHAPCGAVRAWRASHRLRSILAVRLRRDGSRVARSDFDRASCLLGGREHVDGGSSNYLGRLHRL